MIQVHNHLCPVCNKMYDCKIIGECSLPYMSSLACIYCKRSKEKGIKDALNKKDGFWKRYDKK